MFTVGSSSIFSTAPAGIRIGSSHQPKAGSGQEPYNRSVSSYAIEPIKVPPLAKRDPNRFESWPHSKASLNLTVPLLPETLEQPGGLQRGFWHSGSGSPLRGRGFAACEEKRGRTRCRHYRRRLWRQRFDSDPRIVAKRIVLDGVPTRGHRPVTRQIPISTSFAANSCTRGKRSVEKNEVSLPLRFSCGAGAGAWHTGFMLIARLKPRVTPARRARRASMARCEFSTCGIGIRRRPPIDYRSANLQDRTWSVRTSDDCGAIVPSVVLTPDLPASMWATPQSRRRRCSEARGTCHSRALGASRARAIDRVSYKEKSTVVFLAGTAVGIIASMRTRGTGGFLAPCKPWRGADRVSADNQGRLVFCRHLECLTTLLFGIWPAWRASRVDPPSNL